MGIANTYTVAEKRKHLIYQLFKYIIYCLLSYNIYIFFRDELQASTYIFVGGVSLPQFVEAFSATIDTAAWVVLLLVFELETYVIPDERIKGSVKWGLHGVRAVCYTFIIYAFYGYVSNFLLIFNAVPFVIDNVCGLAGASFFFIETLDEYISINTDNCLQLANQPLFQLVGTNIIADQSHLNWAMRLAAADAINAADWLLVVMILEFELWLQLRERLEGILVAVCGVIKIFLYTTLFAVAVYWGYEGEFIDFWDAVLWLVAFVFIEMNVFQWVKETQAAKQTT